MKELTETQIKLLDIANLIAVNNRYTPGTNGNFDNLDRSVSHHTPKNIKLIYDELVAAFKLLT